MKFKRIAVIGCGGIGSALLGPLCRFINYSSDDQKPEIVLIDGDNYEAKNFDRQAFNAVGGNKATTKRIELEEEFSSIPFTDINEYLTSANIDGILDGCDLIFSGVDNHATRKLISDFAAAQPTIAVISGGNNYTDGNVQMYVRRDGKDLQPRITDYHDEILNPADKNPAELSCQELAATGTPQLLFTNLMAATIMLMAFYNFSNDKLVGSEAYFDLTTMQVLVAQRQPLEAAGK